MKNVVSVSANLFRTEHKMYLLSLCTKEWLEDLQMHGSSKVNKQHVVNISFKGQEIA